MAPDLAAAVVAARRALGLSQADVARRAGISASYLSRIEGAAWERGGPWPGDGVLRSLARALGVSSTALVALKSAARAGRASSPAGGPRSSANGRLPYVVSIGPEAVDSAARAVVERNPRDGTLRSAQVFVLDERRSDPSPARPEPSYLDVVGAAMACSPRAMLYRVCAADPRRLGAAQATVDQLAGGRPAGQVPNVRTRFAEANPLVLDVLIGDNEVFLALPDRRGHPYLRAGLVVDDPDFVWAIRNWFDETVWHPPCPYTDVRTGPTDRTGAPDTGVAAGVGTTSESGRSGTGGPAGARAPTAASCGASP